jgi:hypothetical protein
LQFRFDNHGPTPGNSLVATMSYSPAILNSKTIDYLGNAFYTERFLSNKFSTGDLPLFPEHHYPHFSFDQYGARRTLRARSLQFWNSNGRFGGFLILLRFPETGSCHTSDVDRVAHPRTARCFHGKWPLWLLHMQRFSPFWSGGSDSQTFRFKSCSFHIGLARSSQTMFFSFQSPGWKLRTGNVA